MFASVGPPRLGGQHSPKPGVRERLWYSRTLGRSLGLWRFNVLGELEVVWSPHQEKYRMCSPSPRQPRPHSDEIGHVQGDMAVDSVPTLGALLPSYFCASMCVRERVWPGISWRCLCICASRGVRVSGAAHCGGQTIPHGPYFCTVLPEIERHDPGQRASRRLHLPECAGRAVKEGFPLPLASLAGFLRPRSGNADLAGRHTGPRSSEPLLSGHGPRVPPPR